MRTIPTIQLVRRMAGSTLVEVALLLAVTAALSGLALRAYDSYRQRQNQDVSGNALWAADTAVRDFVLKNGRLPCPDLDGNGAEDSAGNSCAGQATGRLPFATLGIDPGTLPLNGRIWYTAFVPATPGGPNNAQPAASQDVSASRITQLARTVHAAATGPASTNAPYLPVATTQGELRDCGAPQMKVAYALIWDGRDAPQPPGNCLRDSPDRQVRVHAVGMYEFLGWVFQVAVQ